MEDYIMKFAGRFLKCFFLICFSMYLSGSGLLIPNEALADNFSNDASRNLIYSPISGNNTSFSNIILAQTDKAEKDITTKEIHSDNVNKQDEPKTSSGFSVGLTGMWTSYTQKNNMFSHTVSGTFIYPSVSYTFGKWSLSASMGTNVEKMKDDGQRTLGTSTDTWTGGYNRYEGDIVLRRSAALGYFIVSPQLGFKYFSTKNYDITFITSDNVTDLRKGEYEAYGPTIGGVVALIPGNPETCPVIISITGNAGYFKIKGKDPFAPVYDHDANKVRNGYNVNATGVNIGEIPLYELDEWGAGFNLSMQATYNFFGGFSATIGGRWNSVGANKDYFVKDVNNNDSYMLQASGDFQYMGAFLNLSYSF